MDLELRTLHRLAASSPTQENLARLGAAYLRSTAVDVDDRVITIVCYGIMWVVEVDTPEPDLPADVVILLPVTRLVDILGRPWRESDNDVFIHGWGAAQTDEGDALAEYATNILSDRTGYLVSAVHNIFIVPASYLWRSGVVCVVDD